MEEQACSTNREHLQSISSEVIEEASDEGTSSIGNYSYIYDKSMEQPQKQGKTTKKSKKVKEYMKPIVKKLIQAAMTEEFIYMMADYFGTSELVAKFRPVNQ